MSTDSETPPPLPHRHLTGDLAEAVHEHSSPLSQPDFHLASDPHALSACKQEAISLYVCKCPGTDDILVTPTKPALGGITDFDVKYGAYILQYDSVEQYHEAVRDFNATKADLPAKALRRHSRPMVAPLGDITNAKKIEAEETALDRLLREANGKAEAPSTQKPLQGLRARGESLQQWAKPREAKLPEAHETRNFHQMPLAARGLISEHAQPMTLLRIGFLPEQSREIGEVAHMLDYSDMHGAKHGNPSSKDSDEAAGYIDVLEEAYEPFGTDVNYVTPSWMKTFTRRLSRWKGHMEEEFTLLSPWQGFCVFVPSRARNSIRCYHTFSTSPSERVLVSELRLNILHPASSLSRRANHQHRRSSSDSAESTGAASPTRPTRNSGTFSAFARSRGASESGSHDPSSPAATAFAAAQVETLGATVTRKPLASDASSSSEPPPLPARRKRSQSNAIVETNAHKKSGLNLAGRRQRMSTDEQRADHHEHRAGDGALARAAAAFERMDLSLGQERLGGGRRGRDAKLAKVVIHGPGQAFLDLLVAANMLLFNRAWQLAKQD